MTEATASFQKTETNETVWSGELPAERLHDVVKRAVLEAIGLSVWNTGVTVDLVYQGEPAPSVAFRVTQDHNHWRKGVEAQADRAAYDDAIAR